MKKILFFLSIFLLIGTSEAQLGSRYFWCDTIGISTTHVDTIFSDDWELATIFSDTLDVWLKVGAPDYSGWVDRNPFKLEAGMSLTIGPTPKLKRLEAWVDDSSGFLYIIGYKTERQF